jgi:hypothetical protein
LFTRECLGEVKLLFDATVGVMVEEFLADRRDGLLIVVVCLAGDLCDCALADALLVARVEGSILGHMLGVMKGVIGNLAGKV